MKQPLTSHETPVLRMLIPFIAGIIASYYVEEFPNYHVIALMVILGVAGKLLKSIKTRRIILSLALFGLLFLAGQHLGRGVNHIQSESHFAKHVELSEASGWGIIRDAHEQGEKFRKLELEELHFIRDDKWYLHSGKLLAYLKRAQAEQPTNYGDTLFFSGTIRSINGPNHPGAFDFKSYCAKKQIYHQIWLDPADWSCRPHNGVLLRVMAASMRDRCLQIYQEAFPTKSNRAVLSALTLGFRAELSKAHQQQYVDAGAIHVLAVSGLHVGIVAAVLFYLLGDPRRGPLPWRLVKSVIGLACIWFFALITGLSPSATRAAMMLSLMLMGCLLYRNARPMQVMGTCALVMLILEPYLLFNLGFQFSFLSLAGIFLFFKPVYGLIYFRKRWIQSIWQLSAVSISAQLALLPLSVYYFNQFPLFFILSSVIAVPLAAILLKSSLAFLILHMISPAVARCIAILIDGVLTLLNHLMALISAIPVSTLDNLHPDGLQVLLMYILIASFYIYSKLRKRLIFHSSMVILALNILYNSSLEVYAQDSDKLIISADRNGYQLEFFDGTKCYTISNNESDSYLNQASIKFQGDQRITASIPLTPASTFGAGSFQKEGNNYALNDIKILVCDSTTQNSSEAAEIILLTAPLPSSLDQLLKLHHPSQVILDYSLSFAAREMAISICKKQNINIHDLRSDGAFLKLAN